MTLEVLPKAQDEKRVGTLGAVPEKVTSHTPLLSPRAMPPGHSENWASTLVIFYVMFVSEAARGLVLPSQWSYLAETLNGTETQLGALVSSFSLGRLLATIPLGYLSDTWSSGSILLICCMLATIGSVGYATARSFTWLLLTRILTGVGSATVSVCRAHIARATSVQERTAYFSYLSAVQFIGFAVLPILGVAFSALPQTRFGKVILDEFRYPGWVLALLNLSAIGALFAYYRDPPKHTRGTIMVPCTAERPDIERLESSEAAAEASPATRSDAETGPTADNAMHNVSDAAQSAYCAAGPEVRSLNRAGAEHAMLHADRIKNVDECHEPAVASRRSGSGYDTATVSDRSDRAVLITCLLINICFRGVCAVVETIIAPNLVSGEGLSITKTSLSIGVLGIIGLLAYLALRPLSAWYGDYPLVVGGLAMMTLGTLVLVAQSRYTLPLWIYFIALSTIWSIGYPIGQTATLSLFSKVLTNVPTGGFLGIFSAAGSVARLTFATLAGFLDDKAGAGGPFVLSSLVCVTCLVLTILYRRKFIAALYPAHA